MDKDTIKLVKDKLLLLYLLYKMDIPLTYGQISTFALEAEYMDYFSFQTYFTSLVEDGYIEKTTFNNQSCYAITDDGIEVVELFPSHIPEPLKEDVLRFVRDNKLHIKEQFSVFAHYFYNSREDYICKCGIYEDEITLIDFTVSVPSKKDAIQLCDNFKKNSTPIYKSILDTLLHPPVNEKSDKNGAQGV